MSNRNIMIGASFTMVIISPQNRRGRFKEPAREMSN